MTDLGIIYIALVAQALFDLFIIAYLIFEEKP